MSGFTATPSNSQAFGLGPFAFQYRNYTRLAKDVSLARFGKELADQLVIRGKPQALPRRVVDSLYCRCLELNALRKTVTQAGILVHDRRWKKEKENLRSLVRSLHLYSKTDANCIVQAAPNSESLRRMAGKLRKAGSILAELAAAYEWWEHFSVMQTWSSRYRDAVIRMGKYLKAQKPQLRQTEITDIIRVAIDTAGLKDQPSQESISRMLYRYSRTHLASGQYTE